MALASTIVTVVMCGVAIIAYRGQRDRAYLIAKLLASAGFLGVALSQGLPDDGWRAWVTAGLVAALLGDTVLALKSTRAFIAGMGLFAAMHLSYLMGFLSRGPEWDPIMIVGSIVAIFVLVVWRWATPHLPLKLRPAIAAYMGLLALDLTVGVASAMARPGTALALGVVMVCLSDVAVVRQRFVTPGIANKLVGLPMYYAGQLLLAWTIAAFV